MIPDVEDIPKIRNNILPYNGHKNKFDSPDKNQPIKYHVPKPAVTARTKNNIILNCVILMYFLFLIPNKPPDRKVT